MRRVKDPDDPNRCQSPAEDGGQCWNETEDGQTLCLAHGGKRPDKAERVDYLTEQFERRVKLETTGDEEIKLLRENLMVINQMLAARRNAIQDQGTMIVHAPAIADLLMKAEKVTTSLHRLSTQQGLLLAKPALITWGKEIVDRVASKIEGKYDGWEDDLLDLSDEVAQIIVTTRNTEE